ncbi:unnamed protein product [Dracunculus medinensis]|uniref:Uncharacterized protein n=1 Tax=Dracunculus medinensis TaxID=318479 RepID=A0A0N4UQ40_DRAME|nr:unnamed protein product [Dracunculus medinensis]
METVATPYMVRGAIIEALNLPKEQFPYFNTGEDFINSFYLVGQCLPSLLSILIKTCLSDKINEWPIRLITSGASYRTFSSHRATDENINLYNAPQQMLVTLLIICNSAIEESLEYDNIINRLQKLFLIKLPLNCHIDNIPPDQLFNFESAASSLRTESNIEVARISRSGTYISNRLNVVYGSNIKTQFVFLVNAEINLTRVVATVFEDYMVDSKPIPSEIQYLLKSHCQL